MAINSEPQTAPDNIDQIRDIIFGAQKREYDRRFEQIESAIAGVRNDLLQRISEVHDQLTSEIMSVGQSMDKRIRLLTTSTQEDTASLRNQIDVTDRKLSNTLAALAHETSESAAALNRALGEMRSKVQDEMRVMREHMTRELDTHVQALREGKISKDAMAEILFELGMRLKDGGLSAEIDKATRSRQGT